MKREKLYWRQIFISFSHKHNLSHELSSNFSSILPFFNMSRTYNQFFPPHSTSTSHSSQFFHFFWKMTWNFFPLHIHSSRHMNIVFFSPWCQWHTFRLYYFEWNFPLQIQIHSIIYHFKTAWEICYCEAFFPFIINIFILKNDRCFSIYQHIRIIPSILLKSISLKGKINKKNMTLSKKWKMQWKQQHNLNIKIII